MRIFFCLLFLTGFAGAQDLSCKRLLESLPETRFNELTSFEATFSYQETSETIRIRQIEDVKGQRTYYETVEASNGEKTIVRYEGNAGTLVGSDGQLEVAPPREEIDVLPFLDVFLSQQIFAKAELLSCDGQQTLETPEGTLQGEAVTVRLEDDEGQLLFDANDHIIGWKSERDVGVFENEYKDDLLVKSSFRIYVKSEETASVDTATLERTMTFELVNYNQPVDESLFSVTGNLECGSLLETFKDEPELTSLETSTTYTAELGQSSDYKVVDFEKQRIYWEVPLDGVKNIYRFVDGEVTAITKINGEQETTEVPDYIRVSLESTFTSNASFQNLAEKAVVLSCDGERSYSDENGEIVRGQQITVAGRTNSDSESAKLLFDDSGEFIGNYVDRPDDGQDILLLSLDRKRDGAGVTVEITNATYVGESNYFELLSKTTTKTLSYNQPIDETLFEP